MNKLDGNAPLTPKILGQFLLHLLLIGFRRMVLFVVVIGAWGLLNATQIGFLQTIAPFVGIFLAFVVYSMFLRKPRPKIATSEPPN